MLSSLLAKLRRITTGQHYIAQIDGLRMAAILPVLLLHLTSVLRDTVHVSLPDRGMVWHAISEGTNGVYLFFAISGYILALPFARCYLLGAKPIQLSRYFLRRVTRLEPPYILSVLLIFAIKIVASHSYERHTSFGFLWPHLLATLAYCHTLIYHVHSLVSSLTWSLEIEVQFYCLMPLLAILFFRIYNAGLRRAILLLVMLLNGVAATHWSNSYLVNCTIAGFFPYFCAGLLLADLYVTGAMDWFSKEHRIGWRITLDVCAVLLWPASFLLPTSLRAIVLPFIIILLFIDALRGWAGPKLLGLKPIAIIGGMCYTMYLYQFLVFSSMGLFMRRFTWLPFTKLYLATAAVLIPALLVFTIAMYLLVERPCMNPEWPNRLLALFRRKAQPAETWCRSFLSGS